MSYEDYRRRVFADMTREVHEVNEANGWFEKDRHVMAGHMLIVTEVSEASEAWRAWGTDDATSKVCSFIGHGHDSDEARAHLCKPEGVGSEYADILIRLIDQCERDGIDLVEEYVRKIAYNATRGRHHGGKAL